MSKRGRRRAHAAGSREAAGVAVAGSARLADLERRFGRFRRGHARFTRIPDDLRSLAVAALRSGAAPADIRRACGVTTGQLTAWARVASNSSVADSAAPSARILSVVDDAPEGEGCAEHDASTTLELRLGGWSVVVRPVGG